MLLPYLQNSGLSFPMLQQQHLAAVMASGSQGGGGAPFGMSPRWSPEDDGIKDDPQLELEDKHLWDQFSDCTNEMIITKSGR